MTELKSCPFCGNEPEIERINNSKLHTVRCTHCGCHTSWGAHSCDTWNERTSKDTTLKNCPICAHRANSFRDIHGKFYIICPCCGLMTNTFAQESDAIDTWNRRM